MMITEITTPGLWTAARSETSTVEIMASEHSGRRIVVARAYGWEGDPETRNIIAHANATLIAGTPASLDALAWALRLIDTKIGRLALTVNERVRFDMASAAFRRGGGG